VKRVYNSFTADKMIARAMVLHILPRIIDESSHALREAPTLKIDVRDRMLEKGQTPVAESPEAKRTRMTGADTIAKNEADAKKPQAELTRIWNERIDPDRRFPSFLKQLERMARLTNDVQAVVFYRETDDGERIVWDHFCPNDYSIIQNPNEPDRPLVLILNSLLIDNALQYLATTPRVMQSVWTKDGVRVVGLYTNEKNQQVYEDQTPEWLPDNQDGVNPYHFIPAVTFRSQKPEGRAFYGKQAEDLLTFNQQLNRKWTALNYIEDLQGFGVPYVQGLAKEDKDSFEFGPDILIQLEGQEGEKPMFGFADPHAPLAELRKGIKELVQHIAEQYGLDGNSILQESTRGGGTASGAAKRMDSQRLIDLTVDLREMFEPSVIELIRKTLLVWKTWNPSDPDAKLIPESLQDIKVEVRFAPLDRQLDEKDAYALRQAKQRDGIFSVVDTFTEEHPEVDDEAEALASIKHNKDLNQQAGFGASPFGDPAAMAGAIPGRPGFGKPGAPGQPSGPGEPQPAGDAAVGENPTQE
jgi:hypothetical protein